MNFNTGILDILHGCELLSNANRPTLGLGSLCFSASRSLSQREPEQSTARTYRPLLSSAGTVALYFAALAVWLGRVRLPTAFPSRVSRFSRLRRLLWRRVSPLNVKGVLIKWCGAVTAEIKRQRIRAVRSILISDTISCT